MCGYWNSLTSGYPSGPIIRIKTMLESVGAGVIREVIKLCFVLWRFLNSYWCLVERRAPILHSVFRKLLHLQIKVAFLLYSCLLNLCWRKLPQEVILYLVIWKKTKNNTKKTTAPFLLPNQIAVFISTSIISWFLGEGCAVMKDPIHSEPSWIKYLLIRVSYLNAWIILPLYI